MWGGDLWGIFRPFRKSLTSYIVHKSWKQKKRLSSSAKLRLLSGSDNENLLCLWKHPCCNCYWIMNTFSTEKLKVHHWPQNLDGFSNIQSVQSPWHFCESTLKNRRRLGKNPEQLRYWLVLNFTWFCQNPAQGEPFQCCLEWSSPKTPISKIWSFTRVLTETLSLEGTYVQQRCPYLEGLINRETLLNSCLEDPKKVFGGP